jgi:hypothetical protein
MLEVIARVWFTRPSAEPVVGFCGAAIALDVQVFGSIWKLVDG